VLNVLAPLLKGKGHIVIPATVLWVTAHENFRLFAAQNEALYIGRKELPSTLRNSFLEVKVPPVQRSRAGSHHLAKVPPSSGSMCSLSTLKWKLQPKPREW
jgi:MoxR-like ATPase